MEGRRSKHHPPRTETRDMARATRRTYAGESTCGRRADPPPATDVPAEERLTGVCGAAAVGTASVDDDDEVAGGGDDAMVARCVVDES